MSSSSAVKIKLKCGVDELGDEFCSIKEYKVLFPNDTEKDRFLSDQDLIIELLKKNRVLKTDLKNDSVDISVVRDIDLPLDQWEEVVNEHKPDGKRWDDLSDVEKLRFIAKYLNGHPRRPMMEDPIVVCTSD